MLCCDSRELNRAREELAGLVAAFPTLVLVFSSKSMDESSGLQWICSMDGKTIPKSRRGLGLF